MDRLSTISSGWRNWMFAAGLSVAMHAGIFWSVAETATKPQFRIAQELSVTLVQQSEQRVRSVSPAAEPAEPAPSPEPALSSSPIAHEEPARIQEEQQEVQLQQKQKRHSASEAAAPADHTETADREDYAGQPLPQTKQAIYSADYLNNPLPRYPNAARRRGLEGQVLLNVEVLAAGGCGRINILQSSGHAVLDDAAIEAVKRWHFVPASNAGVPVDHWLHVPIRFRLSGKEGAG